MTTLFSKILAEEIPAEKIYQTEYWFSILDLFPVVPGHLLVISREEQATVADLAPATLADLGAAVARGTALLRAALGCPAVSVLLRDGREAGQEIPHVHVHLVPRFEESQSFQPGSYGDDDATVQAAMRAMGDRLRREA